MQKILVPVDGSHHALKALHIASDLTEKYGGSILLLHILNADKPAVKLLGLATVNTFGSNLTDILGKIVKGNLGPVPHNILEAVGEKILAQAATRVRRRGLEVEVLRIEIGTPSEIILKTQKCHEASTIVMGCRGVSNSKKSAFGSVSQNVFTQATCTCLSVK